MMAATMSPPLTSSEGSGYRQDPGAARQIFIFAIYGSIESWVRRIGVSVGQHDQEPIEVLGYA